MARVTVEDCVDKVPNRFELVMLAAHRAREIAAGSPITVADDLRERMIEANQTQIEIDEPEEDSMSLLMGAEADRPVEDDMSEEKLLRALMEAQGQR